MRRRNLFVLAAVLAIAAAGCGGSSEQSASERVRLAATETQSAKTARMAFTMGGMAQVGEIDAEGEVDFAANRGTMEMSMPAVEGRSLGEIEMVYDGLVLYMKFPPAMAEEFGDKPWVKMDTGQMMRESTGVDMSSLAQGSGNPSDALAYLRGAGTATEEIGTETLRGEETTHYRTTIDAEAMIEGADESAREEARKLAEILGDQSIPADVWLDEEGRMRKMSYSVDPSKMKLSEPIPDEMAGARLEFTFELYDFGTPVDVTIPPADQTTDFSQVLSQLGD